MPGRVVVAEEKAIVTAGSPVLSWGASHSGFKGVCLGAQKGGPMLYVGVLVGTVAFELACLMFVMIPPHTRKH
jgi:hypothetical protein